MSLNHGPARKQPGGACFWCRLFSWNTTLVPDGIHYRLKVIVTDSLLYGTTLSQGDFTINNPGNAVPELDLFFHCQDLIISDTISVNWFAGDADGDTVFIHLSNLAEGQVVKKLLKLNM